MTKELRDAILQHEQEKRELACSHPPEFIVSAGECFEGCCEFSRCTRCDAFFKNGERRKHKTQS